MQLFIDSANLSEIEQAMQLGLIDGVTTNPSLIAKAGIKGEKNSYQHYKSIVQIVNNHVSAEVIAQDFDAMLYEAKKIADIDEKIVVKIPMTYNGLRVIKILSQEGIQTNCTLIFTCGQALLAAKAGASYVSPFIGRLDDINQDGLTVLEHIIQMFQQYNFSTKVLAASIRHTLHWTHCAKMGVDIVTCPLKIITNLIHHPLTEKGLQIFLDDHKKNNF